MKSQGISSSVHSSSSSKFLIARSIKRRMKTIVETASTQERMRNQLMLFSQTDLVDLPLNGVCITTSRGFLLMEGRAIGSVLFGTSLFTTIAFKRTSDIEWGTSCFRGREPIIVSHLVPFQRIKLVTDNVLDIRQDFFSLLRGDDSFSPLRASNQIDCLFR